MPFLVTFLNLVLTYMYCHIPFDGAALSFVLEVELAGRQCAYMECNVKLFESRF